jgi:uncharacterized membrane protein
MSYFEFLLFGHLIAAMVWLGGDLMLQMFYLRARVAGPAAVAQFAKDVEWIGLRVLNTASLLVVIFGVLMVIDADFYDFSQFWITAALAMFLLSAVTGAAFLGPETGRIAALSEAKGPEHPEVLARVNRVVVISRIEFFLLVLIVLDMVLKPGL